jgi:hypothetical protein
LRPPGLSLDPGTGSLLNRLLELTTMERTALDC